MSDLFLGVSWVLKIITSSLDAASESGDISVHCTGPVSCRDLTDLIIQSVLQLLNIWEKFTTDLLLQPSKQPEIWRVEIQAVGWMWDLQDPVLMEPVLHVIGPVGGCPIVQYPPPASSPHLGSASSHSIMQMIQNVQVHMSVNSLSPGDESAIHKSISIKENDCHHLWNCLFSDWDCWSGSIGLEPCPVVTPGVRIPGVEPCLISTNNMVNLSSSAHGVQSSSCTMDSSLHLCIGQMMRDPVGTLFLQVKILLQHSKCRSNTQISASSNLPHCLASILLHNCLNCLDFCCSSAQRLTWMGQILHLIPAILEGCKPLPDGPH